MSTAFAALLLSASLFLVVSPLAHILQTGRLSEYLVFFLTTVAFLILNLIGSFSHNVQNTGEILSLQFGNFAISLTLALTFLLLTKMRENIYGNVTSPFRDFKALERISDQSPQVAFYVAAMLALSLLVVAYFSLTVAMPLWLRFDLFGHWWALIEERWKVVRGAHKWHWYSLAYFAAPLLLTCLLMIMWRACRAVGDEIRARQWLIASLVLIPLFVLLSVSYLHKVYAIYQLAAIAAVLLAFGGRVFRIMAVIAAAVLVVSAGLYIVYSGPGIMALLPGMLFHRMSEVYPWVSATVLSLYPASYALNGTSIINFFGLFPYKQVDLAAVIYPHIYAGFEGGAPVPALFEMYANFGWLGFALGLAITVWYIIIVTLMSWSRDPVVLALSIFLAVAGLTHIWDAAFWFGALEPPTIIFCAAAYWLWRFMPQLRMLPFVPSLLRAR